MSSEVEICNVALSYLGQDPIISIEEPSSRVAELCALHYPITRDAMTELRMWSFAIAKITSNSTQLDEWEQRFVHPKPDGWLKVFRAYRSLTLDSRNLQIVSIRPRGVQSQWNMENDKIVADDSFLFLWGVEQITDTNRFPKTFVKALAARLAVDMCMAITESRSLREDMAKLYDVDLQDASSRDGGQGRSELIEANQLIGVRFR